MNLSTKQTHRHREKTCGCQGGWGREDWEFGVRTCKLLYREWVNNNVLVYSTGSYTAYPVINHNGEEYEKEQIHMYN